MSRYPGALLKALAVVFVLGALTASAAQARESFIAGAYPATLTGTPLTVHEWEVSGRSVICAEASFKATLAAKSTELKVTPTYEECFAVVLGNEFPATVEMNGCDYLFTTDPGGAKNGPTHIKCPVGKQIELHVYLDEEHTKVLCTYDVKAQERGKMEYENVAGPPEELKANANVTNIETTRTGSLAQCGPAATTATYSGNTKFSATSGGKATGIKIGP